MNAVVSQILAMGEKDKEERSALESSALRSAKKACQLSRENGATTVQTNLAEMYLGLAGMYEDKLAMQIAGDLVKRLNPDAAGEELSILLAGSLIVVVLGGSGAIIKKILDRNDLNLETKLTIIGMVLGLAKVAVHGIVEISKSER